MAFIRWFLGKIILTLNFLTPPKGIKRSPEAQAQVDKQTRLLALYQFHACPFCVKVRRAMKRFSLDIELRDAKNNDTFRQELLENGGRVKVPCLRITNDDGSVSWMYESNDIIRYLEQRFVSE
ncbi:glutathione S-transferase N-terminal domain-containing protein [Neptunomonas concharum]|jgi:glutaredoxin|uniref:Glutaredoxin n=1 Tax=Neptunomonas concharum TaxID=1031538 RepID=A0A5P1R7A8_9GAMM|nr:glutathione S-transferase N-terminal domain-containing protein [Neptunomonas concharum]QEQ95549.1 glutaredoxin [Neptunomonas concharum]